MKFKRFVAALICMLLLTMNGCSRVPEVKDSVKNELEGSITIWSSKENLDTLKMFAENYNKLHSKVTVNIIEAGSNELLDKLQMALISKENLPDIICVEDEYAQELIKKQSAVFEDTGDDLKKDNYLKYKVDNLTFEGKLYGFPLTSIPAVLVFRTEVLEKGPINIEYIKTWEDYVSLKTASALPFEEESLYRAFLNQLGGSYFDKEEKLELNSEKTLRAAETMKKMYISGMIKNTGSFEEVSSLIKKEQIDSALISSKELGGIYKQVPELKSKLIMVKPPAYEAGGNQAVNLGGSNLLLISSSKNKSLALDFSKFSTENRDNLKALITEFNIIPAYTYYYDEKDFADKRLLELVKEIYPINYTENFLKVRENIKMAVSGIIIKGQNSKETLEELQKNLSIQFK
jgi:ABC-type glycerol-3-phosphate transport system substrate-binding protein